MKKGIIAIQKPSKKTHTHTRARERKREQNKRIESARRSCKCINKQTQMLFKVARERASDTEPTLDLDYRSANMIKERNHQTTATTTTANLALQRA